MGTSEHGLVGFHTTERQNSFPRTYLKIYIWFPLTLLLKTEIHTRKDCLHDKHTSMLVRFDDNALWMMDKMNEAGPEFTLSEYDLRRPERVEESKKSTWKTESDSSDRFFEIIFKELIDKKNIDIKNPETRKKLGRLKSKYNESVKKILKDHPDIDLASLFFQIGDYAFVGHEG